MNTLILHHNLSLHLAFIASVAATFTRFFAVEKTCVGVFYHRESRLHPDALAFNMLSVLASSIQYYSPCQHKDGFHVRVLYHRTLKLTNAQYHKKAGVP